MNELAPARRLTPTSHPIAPARFAHFVLRTGRFDRMAEWCRSVLVARTVFRDERLCRDVEAGMPMAELLRIPPLPDGKTPRDMLPQG